VLRYWFVVHREEQPDGKNSTLVVSIEHINGFFVIDALYKLMFYVPYLLIQRSFPWHLCIQWLNWSCVLLTVYSCMTQLSVE